MQRFQDQLCFMKRFRMSHDNENSRSSSTWRVLLRSVDKEMYNDEDRTTEWNRTKEVFHRRQEHGQMWIARRSVVGTILNEVYPRLNTSSLSRGSLSTHCLLRADLLAFLRVDHAFCFTGDPSEVSVILHGFRSDHQYFWASWSPEEWRARCRVCGFEIRCFCAKSF